MNKELIITDATHCKIWTFTTDETAAIDLNRAKEQQIESINTWKSHCENYPESEIFKTYLKEEQATRYEIMSYEQFTIEEREKLLSGSLQEITAERFDEMLDVLPPLLWCVHNGIEMFCIREMYTSTYTNQYAHDKNNNKFYTKMVDSADKSTWICEMIK